MRVPDKIEPFDVVLLIDTLTAVGSIWFAHQADGLVIPNGRDFHVCLFGQKTDGSFFCDAVHFFLASTETVEIITVLTKLFLGNVDE